MKKSKKSQVFHIGDIIKIKNPEFFVRCGYPLSKEDIRREFLADKKKLTAFREFLRSIGLISSVGDNELFFMVESDQYSDILDRICFNLLKKQKFGGNERSIKTISIPELKNKEFKVGAKKIVQTGNRVNGSSRCGLWDVDYEYDPPYLSNQKSHVILTLDSISFEGCSEIFEIGKKYFGKSNYFDLQIEEINVELVKDLIEQQD